MEKRILVALGDNPKDDRLFRAALDLGKGGPSTPKRPLHLIHVFEEPVSVPAGLLDWDHGNPRFATPWLCNEGSSYPGEPELSYSDDSAQARLTSAFDSCAHIDSWLAALRREALSQGVDATTEILYGRFPEPLLTGDFQESAQVLVVGAPTSEMGWLRPHQRRILRLLRRFNTTVLVIPEQEGTFDFGKAGFRILIADDLSHRGLAPLHQAEDFIDLLGTNPEIRHIHVTAPWVRFHPATEYELAFWPQLAPLRHPQDDELRDLGHRLRQRGDSLRRLVESRGGNYTVKVAHGKVSEEIEHAAKIYEADLCLVGSHRAFHWNERGVSRGHLPMAHALRLHGGCCVVPPLATGDALTEEAKTFAPSRKRGHQLYTSIGTTA